ncbi:MAG: S41 family peptidase [Fischerella sp. CENA71]|nr:S41 family peptidase [Fischerella sp. CENA71]
MNRLVNFCIRFVAGFFLITALLGPVIAAANSLNGVWRSDGYGLLFEIQGNTIRRYQVTEISCIASKTTLQVTQIPSRAKAKFVEGTPPEIEEYTIKPDASNGSKRVNLAGTVSDIVFRRIPRRPLVCEQAVTNNPQTNFEVFWKNFDENYPLFAMKKVNWFAVREKYRTQVTQKTTPEQLFKVLSSMIEPLRDAHTSIIAEDIEKSFDSNRFDSNPVSEQGFKRAEEIIYTKYISGPLRFWAKGKVSYGMLNPSIGYLRLTSFAEYTDSGLFADAFKELEIALDSVFRSKKLQGLVIDVRVNNGGSDVLGLAIASRLTSKPYLAYSKVARNDPNNYSHFTKPQPSIVRPNAKPGFLGPVVLLTSRYSVSAAETFAQALMGRQPKVIRVGENTQGVFSDVLNRQLPNKWQFGLPNELFLTEDGKIFDVAGIPPDILVTVFQSKDLNAGRDSALEKALQVLTTDVPNRTNNQS